MFILKALLTAFIALWLAYRLELPQPGTVLVTVFIVMQPQSGQVLAKSFYRIIGTLLGLTVMVALIALFNQERVLFMLAVAIWIGLCTAGAARYRDFRGYACVLAGYTAVIIGLPATLHPEGAFMSALWRVLEITLGILCTGLVSALVLPQTSSADLRATLQARFRDSPPSPARAGRAPGQRALRGAQRTLRRRRRGPGEPAQRHRLRRPAHAPACRAAGAAEQRVHGAFHALPRLAPVAQPPGRAGRRATVREALAPPLAEVAALLAAQRERLGSDAEAAEFAGRLAACRQELMQLIRAGRGRLAVQQVDEAGALDFDTAAELLFRFVDDLHGYALTLASLLDHRHAREDWRESFRPRANPWPPPWPACAAAC